MNKLKKEELELFYRLDEKKYLVDKNIELNNIIANYFQTYNLDDIQDFIDKLACWYYVKLPDKILENKKDINYDLLDKINHSMNLNTLFNNLNTFEFCIINSKDLDDKKCEYSELLCKQLFIMAGYQMLYHKNSSPEYGIARIKYMFMEFNNYFNWNLDINIYNDILLADYSMNNPHNMELLLKLREEQAKTKSKEKKKKRRSRSIFCS